MANLRPNFKGDPLEIIQTIDQASKGVGDWVANGQPTSAVGQAIQSGYRKQCDLYSNAPQWVRDASPASLAGMEDLCSPYLGNNGSGGPVMGSPPFSGGQCAGVGYRVRVTGPYMNSNFFTSIRTALLVTNVTGPITGISSQVIQQDVPAPGYSRFRITVTNASGQVGQYDVPNPGEGYESVSYLVDRVDGLPDDCGSLPGEPAPNPNPRPVPVFDPSDLPFLDDKGRIVLPMPEIEDPFGRPVQLPNLPIPDFGGESLYGDDDGPPPTPTPGEPGTPVETGDGEGGQGGEAEGGDSSKELVGILLEALQVPPYARKTALPVGDAFIGAAYVFLGFDGRLDGQPEAASIVFPQFFFAEPGSTHWRVVSRVGYNLRVTPYYRERVE